MHAECLPGWREAEAARAALCQRHAKPAFERPDVMADDRPREAQRARGTGKAAAAHHGGEDRHRA